MRPQNPLKRSVCAASGSFVVFDLEAMPVVSLFFPSLQHVRRDCKGERERERQRETKRERVRARGESEKSRRDERNSMLEFAQRSKFESVPCETYVRQTFWGWPT